MSASTDTVLTLHRVCVVVGGLAEHELQGWVAREWVRPVREAGEPRFGAAEVARVRLILELRDAMAVGEEAMPVVLGLLDQLYEERRRMRRLCDAIREAGFTEPVGRLVLGE